MNTLKLLGLALMIILTAVGQPLGAQESHLSGLTASDLAEVLSIHWWTIQLPKDLKPKDMVGVEVVSADGKRLEGGGGVSFWPAGKKFASIRIFCWEDKALHQANVMIQTPDGSFGTFPIKDYFKYGGIGGAANGAVLKMGDILIKFDPSKSSSFNGGNTLQSDQVGLRAVVTRAR